LISEARNSKSPIFRQDAREVLSKRLSVAVAADFARRNSLSKSSGNLRRSSVDILKASEPSIYPSILGKRSVEMMNLGNGAHMEEGVVSLGPSQLLGTPKLEMLEYPSGIVFKVFQNDGTAESLMRLTDMKQIFHKQLPKMPKTYISRLVFDLEHRTLVCMLDGKSIGGITFRPFPAGEFIEITFCAVTTDRQVRGFGSLIMTHLKAYSQGVGLFHFLTYADSFAVGYFSKQGFSAKVQLARDVWAGRIKDYDGATLMHCVLHPKLNYVEFQKMLANARELTEERIDTLSGGGVVHKGLAHFKGKKKKERIENIADIPGVLESGWDPALQTSNNVGEEERVYEELDSLLQSIKRHSYAWPFKEAVDRQQVPNYYKVISDPIDLQMIEERLRSKTYYVRPNIFVADLRRMLENCKEFNNAETSYHKCAIALEKFIDGQLDRMKIK
jgi:N-acetylglutamate synthase-like GNAT family acetyltransferase